MPLHTKKVWKLLIKNRSKFSDHELKTKEFNLKFEKQLPSILGRSNESIIKDLLKISHPGAIPIEEYNGSLCKPFNNRILLF